VTIGKHGVDRSQLRTSKLFQRRLAVFVARTSAKLCSLRPYNCPDNMPFSVISFADGMLWVCVVFVKSRELDQTSRYSFNRRISDGHVAIVLFTIQY
jgi:hypothetical protein